MDITPKETDTISTVLSEQLSPFSHEQNQKVLDQTIAMMINQISKQKNKKYTSPSATLTLTNSRKWSSRQTQHFFKLLQVFGTDFTMMSHHHEFRSKKQLLNKYKKQHKRNSQRVQEILNQGPKSALFLKYESLQAYQP